MGNSGSGPTTPTPGTVSDPSMEDILASIRRILNEDDKAPEADEPPARPGQVAATEDSVLLLDESMMVGTDEPEAHAAAEFGHPETTHADAPRHEEFHVADLTPDPVPPPVPGDALMGLIGAAAADAAASSVGNLVRTLAAERNTPVYRGGPSIEDLVLLEIRPLLKSWLDRHLPPLVERLVQAEIERVVKRAL